MEKQRYIGLENGNKEKYPKWLEKVREYYGGEAHSHSRWSDRGEVEGGGKEKTVHNETRLLEYADKLGLDFVVFSEHASDPGDPVKLPESHPICQSLLKEKQRINGINSSDKYSAQAFSAVEASIFFDKNGEAVIDLPDSVLFKLDLVIASRHAITEEKDPSKIKESLLAAIDNPEVDVIGHPYRHIEFYEHDWNYFKKYWRKDPVIKQELESLERDKKWDKIKQIIGKDRLGDNERIKELNRQFSELKKEYWQGWEEVLKAMEEKGKAFEINLNSFDPNKEFYRSLLERAVKHKDLNFSITYDFHSLGQLDSFGSKDSLVKKPEGVKSFNRARRIQRLLDLIDILEELGVGKNRIINSSRESLEGFIDDRARQRKSHYLKKSEDKELGNIELMGQKLGQEIVGLEIEELEYEYTEEKINKLLIKYKTADDVEFYLKKNDNYDARRVNELMRLMNREMPGKTNEVINLDDEELIVYKVLQGNSLKEKIITNNDERGESAVKSASLIYDFHNLDPAKFKDYINDKNYNLEKVRHSAAGRDFVQEIGQNDKQLASELDSLYIELSAVEEVILKKSDLVLVHGDFHPGNVLIDSKSDTKLIDYKNLTMGIRERDLASMLEQIYAQGQLGEHKVSEEMVAKWQESFLNSYKGEVDENKLVFYRAWISWRNAMYCFSKYFLHDGEDIDMRNGKIFMENARKYLEEYKERKN